MNAEERLYNLAREIDARVAAVEQAAKTGETSRWCSTSARAWAR